MAKTVTLADAVDGYLESLKGHLLPRTIEVNGTIASEFLRFIGSKHGLRGKYGAELIDGLARKTQAWVNSMIAEGLKPSTIHWKMCTIRALFNWCIRFGYMTVNPAAFVRMPPVPSITKPIYTHDEYLKIINAAKGTHNYWLVVCAYRTGLSMVDICNLKWESVDMINLMISLRRQKMKRKGAGAVTVPFVEGSDIHECLLTLQDAEVNDAWPGPGYVHHGLARMYQTEDSSVVRSYKRLLAKVGIEGRSFKSWRNTFISKLANSGVNHVVACKMSGHSNPAQFAAYVKPDVVAMRQAIVISSEFMEGRNENKIQIKSPAKT